MRSCEWLGFGEVDKVLPRARPGARIDVPGALGGDGQSGALTDTLPKRQTAGLEFGGGGGLEAEITLLRHRAGQRAGCVTPRDLES